MFTTETKDHVLDVLVRALSPYVGATMARASVRGLCEKLDLQGTKLSRPQVEQLIEALAPGLHVFVGKEKARALVIEIWKAIDALGGDP